MKNTKLHAFALALSAGMIGTMAPQTASAADAICTINSVAFAEPASTTSGELALYCVESNFYAWRFLRGGDSTCAVRSADSVKMWLSLAQAALLSGKSLQIYYETCAGFRQITSMHLIK